MLNDEEKTANALYGNPGGSPADPGTLNNSLGTAFDAIEYGARDNGDHDYAATIAAARKDLVTGLEGLGAGPGVARDLSELIADYHKTPRDEATIQKNLDGALAVLSEEWGDNFNTTFAGAKKVMAKLIGSNVANAEFFHGTGLTGDVRFLRLVGAIAKAQGEKRGSRSSGRPLPSGDSLADRLYGGDKD